MSVELSIPILIEKIHPPEEHAFYRVRPVFFTGFEQVDGREDRALRRLRDELRKTLTESAGGMRHDMVSQWAFHPKLRHRRLDLVFNLRKHTLRSRIYLVMFESLGRTIAASPQLAEISFEVLPGESVEQRALEVFTEHFRALEKDGVNLSDYQFEEISYAHLDTIELTLQGGQELPEDGDNQPFAMLGEQQSVSGAYELERTGRCLNLLYPNDLEHALCRDEELAAVAQWHEVARRQKEAPAPLLLVGSNQVGKTALIHEWVRRMLEGNRSEKAPQVWLLSPQRLISGMSFLGQWEQRVIAILEEAAKENHFLYFDDLLGLFHAGKSRDSSLTVGQVLKLHLEEGKLAVVAEATPAAWRKLREIDRGFADFFRVVHLREPADRDTYRILIRTMQEMEQLHGCRFDPEVLPLIMELPRRFIRGRAFPGKGAEMLRQIAATHPGQEIGKAGVFRFFENKTGVRQQFMDRHEVLETATVAAFFRDRIVGQDEAIKAMVDAIVLAKAQLNDPGRPIASLLFLGPTGVGKTECAKALAEYYFGTPERLVRFDMNEFTGWDSVARLIGSFGGRQGVLTGAIRRRPHAVVLLDEIEKANPDVFDLLLQVLDDGRLTDANGVTTDFCNTILVLTSNLGSQDVKSQVGFGAGSRGSAEIYVDAARKFFRPEFFNRLDQVVAFHELGQEHIEGIVYQLVKKALRRQGLQQRQMSISVDASVYALLSRLGFEKEFGARALRRAVEDHLVEPLAMQLSGVTSRSPAFIHARVDDGEVVLLARALTACSQVVEAPHVFKPREALALIGKSNGFVQRIDLAMESWQEPGADQVTEMDQHYYLVREQLIRVRHERDRLQGKAEAAEVSASRAGGTRAPTRGGRHPKHLFVSREGAGEILSEVFQGADAGRALYQLAETARAQDDVSHVAHQLMHDASLVEYLCRPELAVPDRFLIRFHVNGSELIKGELEGRFEVYRHWVESYLHFLNHDPAVSRRVVRYDLENQKMVPVEEYSIAGFLTSNTCFLYGEGPGFLNLLEWEKGLELFCFDGQGFEYGGIEVIPLQPREKLAVACQKAARETPQLMEQVTEVIRIRHERGWVFDLKSGILTQNPKVNLWTFLKPLLEVPGEFTA